MVFGVTSARFVRFVRFFHSLRKSAHHEVETLSKYLVKDVQSRNQNYIQAATALIPWVAPQARLRNPLTRVTVQVSPQEE